MGGGSRLLLLGAIQVLRNAVGGGVGVSTYPEKSVTKVYGSTDSIFCKQLRKLPICNDKHTLVY